MALLAQRLFWKLIKFCAVFPGVHETKSATFSINPLRLDVNVKILLRRFLNLPAIHTKFEACVAHSLCNSNKSSSKSGM